jgi:S-(hydroxymethyl)glutathione dehydrogenase/alcohol dehydrogenase
MPDGTSRFKCKGKDLLHFMGCSTFSQYTVVADVSVVAITEKAPMDRTCLLGCGITTGYGAAVITAGKGGIEKGATVAIFGAGCVGLSVIQGAVKNEASKIIVVDVNEKKEEWATKFGATDFVNPAKDLKDGETIQSRLVDRWWSRLHLRLHRQRARHAQRSGGLPQGLGREHYHWCRCCWPGDRYPT